MKHSKGNIIFAIFLIILIIGSISTTYYLIIKHNSKVSIDNNNNNNNNYFSFKEVSKKDTIDVFREYPINPIDINLEGQVKISGLKNKEVESKINEKLAKLDVSDKCYVHFNYSNVLSISCDYRDNVNVNLIDGEDITIEDIFQKDSDILAITEDVIYKYSHYSYYDIGSIENYVISAVNLLKSGDYTIRFTSNSIYVLSNHKSSSYTNSIEYYFSSFMDEITIYDRFLTDDSLYEKEVTKYCKPQDCLSSNREYLTPNNVLDFGISNHTDANLDGSNSEKQVLDDSIYSKVRTLLDDTYNFRDEKNYQIVRALITINSTNYGYMQAIWSLDFEKFDKENYAKYLLGGAYVNATPFETKSYLKTNMIITDNNEIKFLEDNPNLIFNDFRETLYNYFVNNDDEFHYLIYHLGYYHVIDNASYAIDLENKVIYAKYCDEWGYNVLDTYIPFDIFTLKQ